MSSVKCVSLDLDGTLLNSNSEITAASKETILSLQENGIEVIINTGRAYQDVIKVPGIQDLNCPIVCVNGSILFSKTGELLFEATLDPSIYGPIFTILKELNVGILVYTNQGGFPSTLPPLHHKTKEELNLLFRDFDYDELFEKQDLKVYKLIALVHPSDLDKIEVVKNALAHVQNISMASSFPNNVEITSSEAHKGKALLRYADLTNIHFDEIYAFGDGGNDLSQFEVSTVAIAMDNAPQSIKDAATYVTKSNDEDGVTDAIKNYLKLI